MAADAGLHNNSSGDMTRLWLCSHVHGLFHRHCCLSRPYRSRAATSIFSENCIGSMCSICRLRIWIIHFGKEISLKPAGIEHRQFGDRFKLERDPRIGFRIPDVPRGRLAQSVRLHGGSSPSFTFANYHHPLVSVDLRAETHLLIITYRRPETDR